MESKGLFKGALLSAIHHDQFLSVFEEHDESTNGIKVCRDRNQISAKHCIRDLVSQVYRVQIHSEILRREVGQNPVTQMVRAYSDRCFPFMVEN